MRVLVVGFGNPLVGDDGCGPAVIERLRRSRLPAGVRVEDGHTDALRLPSLWKGEGEIWLIDALQRGAAPGTVHELGHAEVTRAPQRHASAHRLSLPESLRWIALAHPEMERVRYRLWGVEPDRLRPGAKLSAAATAGVRAVAARVRARLRSATAPAVR